MLEDIIGRKYHRLIIMSLDTSSKSKTLASCICDCGKEMTTQLSAIKSGHTKSCGCYQREQSAKRASVRASTHGLSSHKLHRRWLKIIDRCYNENHVYWHIYGGRPDKYGGPVTLCDEWKNDFMAFYNWAIANGWKEELTIDRKDGLLGYFPDNCRWSTMKEQSRNTRRNVFYTVNGKKRCLAEIAEVLKTPYYNVFNHHHRYGNLDKLLSKYGDK